MNIARKLITLSLGGIAATGMAQVPDLLTSFDAGGRAFGAGGSFGTTAADTLSATNNPAGLGYVNRRTFAIATRNFPTTRTFVTGPLNDLRLDTTENDGDLGLSHVGYAAPMSGGRGTLGFAWTVGGWMHDDQFGFNLPGGIATFHDAAHIRTDFLNFSWGKASANQHSSFGLGLVVGRNSVYNRRLITFSDPKIPPSSARSDDESFGIGVQAGILFNPSGQSNLTWGATIRTPIEMQDDEGAVSIYDKIPGRATFGAALRQDGFRGGRDYVVYGLEVQYFFDAPQNDRINQDDHVAAMFGLEYNYGMESATIPVRLGYALIPAGGDDFADRNSLTFGIGYRPAKGNWYLDVAFGQPDGGGRDTAISLGVRF